MRRLVIWKNNKGEYYHRIINGSYFEQKYEVGEHNQYGHEIVHIIESFDYYRKRVPLKQKVVNRAITFLNKL